MRAGLDLRAQLHGPGITVSESNVRRRSRVHFQLHERRQVHRVDVRPGGLQFQLLTLTQPQSEGVANLGSPGTAPPASARLWVTARVGRKPLDPPPAHRHEPLCTRRATAGDATFNERGLGCGLAELGIGVLRLGRH